MPPAPPKPRPDRPLIEELESRVLLSADLQPVPLDLPDSDPAGDLAARVEMLVDSQAVTSEVETSRVEVVFIDAGVADRETLVTDLQDPGPGRSLEIVLLDGESDGIGQIADFLADREGVDAIHLISHGGNGALQLGTTWLDQAGLQEHATEIAAWGDALAADADLLIYGCDLAAGADGAALVESLAKLTGADVAASVDRTGDGALGGDWDLEYRLGTIEASTAIDGAAQWAGVLLDQPPVNSVPGSQSTPLDTQLLLSNSAGNGFSVDDPDAAGEEIELRLVVTNGTLTLIGPSDPIEVNSETSNAQTTPRVSRDAAGNTLVVWASEDQDGDGFGIFAQRYDVSGNPLGAEFQVNSEALGDQSAPAIAMNASGDFVIAWQSENQDGDGLGVFGQRFDASGAPIGVEFQINSETSNAQTEPALAMDAAGNFVVVWQSSDQDGSGEGLYAQRFDASGATLGSEFRVATETNFDQSDPAVAMNAAGDFVVVWQSLEQDGDSWGIFGQRFDAAGAAVGAEFQVSSEVSSEQTSPAIAMDTTGNFAVAWQSLGQDGSDWGIFAQRFDASGAAQGGEFQVNSTTNQEQSSPAIAMDADGDFAVVWQGKPGNFDVYSQQYTADGTAIGGQTRVNPFGGGDQTSPDIAMDADGDQFVVWDGKAGGGSNDEIGGAHISFAKNLTFVTGDGTDDDVIVVRGTLEDLNEALDGMVFTPTAGFEGTATIGITSDDLGNTGAVPLSDTDTVEIHVGTENSAPTLDPSGDLVLRDVLEDDPDPAGDSVATILASAGGDPIADGNADPEGIAVVGVDDANGSWQYSTDGGGSWLDFGAVSDSAAVLLAGDDLVRFVPDADYAGSAGDLTFRAWDQTAGSPGEAGHVISETGGSSAFSDVTETATLDVTPVNDAPSNQVPGAQTTAEDTPLVFSGANAIRVADVDAGDQDIQVRVGVTAGTLSLATSAGITFIDGTGSGDATLTLQGTVDELNAALDGLRFDPPGDWSGSAQLEIETHDLGNSGDGPSVPALDTVDIDVTPVNDAPTQNVPGLQTTDSSTSLVFSSATGNPITVSDVDADVVQVTLRVSDGTVTLSSVAGLTFGAGSGVDDSAVTFSGDLSAVNAALDGLHFDADPDFTGLVNLEITTDDLGRIGAGGAKSTTSTIAVAVTSPEIEIEDEEAPPGEEIPDDGPGPDEGDEPPDGVTPPPVTDLTPPERPEGPRPDRFEPALRPVPTAVASAASASPLAPSDPERDHDTNRDEEGAFTLRGSDLIGSIGQLDSSLDRLRQDLSESADDERERSETIFAGFRAAALAASTGALTALLRGGSLLALTFSSLPAWKGFDPLAILALTATERRARKAALLAAEEEEDEAVAKMFEED